MGGGLYKALCVNAATCVLFFRVFVYSLKENGTIWDVENLFFFFFFFALRVKLCCSERS